MGDKTIFKSRLTDVDTSAMEDLGTIRKELNSQYKYVKFSGTNAVAVGDAVCYVATDTNNQTVNGALTALAAGIALATVASGTVQYGWIKIKGISLTSWTVPGSVGNPIGPVGATYPALAVPSTTYAPSQFAAYVVKAGVAGTGVIVCDFPF